MEKITFDTMPEALSEILNRLGNLEKMMSSQVTLENSSVVEEQRFNITELCEYLPTKPKKQTVYGWVSAKPPKIPFHKKGELYFIKSEIDAWLAEDGRSTGEDLMAKAREYVSNNPTMWKGGVQNYG